MHAVCSRLSDLRSGEGLRPRPTCGWLGWLPWLLVSLLSCLAADGDAPVPPDPTGTWVWGFRDAAGSKSEAKLVLKLDGTRLTGLAIGHDGKEVPIEETSFVDGQVQFKVTRLFGGKKFATVYRGKVTGDIIEGKAITGREPNAVTHPWTAKRSRPAPKPENLTPATASGCQPVRR